MMRLRCGGLSRDGMLCVVTLIILFFSSIVDAQSQSMLTLHRRLDHLVTHDSTEGLVGVAVMDGRTGRMIYRYRGKSRFVPASNMKLFTAAAALYELGQNYQFHTQIAIQPGTLKQGVVKGNVYVKFSGDPSLKIRQLQGMVTALRKQGIVRIQGNVIIDDSLFQPPNYAPGWTIDSIHWYYSAPITAVAVDQNFIVVKLLATHRIGALIPAKVDQYERYFDVTSRIRAVSRPQAAEGCSLLLQVSSPNQYHFSGCFEALKADAVFKVAIHDPRQFVEALLASDLSTNDIQLTGRLFSGPAPNHLQYLVDHRSAPLSILMKTLLKHSDNFYAGELIKTLGAVYYHRGDFQNGVRAEKAILRRYARMDLRDTPIFDGSGQSYYDRIKPEQFTRLLYHIQHAPFYPVLYQALPISGVDGTLAYRMGGKSPLLGRVHAKTGTLSGGAVTLAGYVKTARGQPLIVSIMVNNAVNLHRARAFQDQVIQILYQY